MGFVEKETLDQIAEQYEEEGYEVARVDHGHAYIDFDDWSENYMSISAIPLSHGCIISAISTKVLHNKTADQLRLWLTELDIRVEENEIVTQTRKCVDGEWTVVEEETETTEQFSVARKGSSGERFCTHGQAYYEDIE